MDEEQRNRRIRKLVADYEQKEIFDPASQTYKQVVIYTGTYYCHPYDNAQLKRVKLLYGALMLAGLLLFFFAAGPALPMNTVWYTALVQTVWLLGALAAGCCLIRFLAAPVRMRKRQYRAASVWLKAFVLIPAAAGITLAVIALVYLTSGVGAFLSSLLCAVLYLFSTLCFLALFYRETRAQYITRQSEGGPDDEI